MVRVAVDAYSLSEGSEIRGIGTFLRAIVAGYAQIPDFEVSALATKATQLPEGVARVRIGKPGHPRLRPMRHDLRLPRAIGRSHCEVFHSPALLPPRHCGVPWLQTLHDLNPLAFDYPSVARERRRWQRLGPRLRHASAVVCDSRSTADQGLKFLDLDPARLHVVHLGVDPAFCPGPAPSGESPYLLIVGTWGPHKGFPEAIAAIDAVADAGFPHRLVVAGFQTEHTRARITAEVARSRRPDRVEVRGYVPDLPALYRGATATLVPSEAEGFGLPALEAMATGSPVLAANSTSLPEVVGDAGILLPPRDPQAWAAATVSLLQDSVLQDELRARGLARAREFTWERTIAAYAELIRSIA